ncbi:MAG: FAD-dependent monooxygenase [Acidothermales bacterium]|nr:FAD-dependent monooxygenase [Acidothermales bacterium]
MTPPAPVAIVGAGPVGLHLALRLVDLGVSSVVVEAGARLRGEGSKALCMQKETLEAWARLGFGEQVAARGVAWTLGRTYYRDRELFQTSFPVVGRDHFPPFVNVSQTEVEELMVARAEASARIDLRWEHELVGLDQDDAGVTLTCTTPDGDVEVHAAYLAGADGSRSTVRRLLDVDFPGHSHTDKFLIADVRAALPFPNERRFFFDPPWNPGRTVLVHPQPDSVWRIDWQVPPDLDLAEERRSGRLDARIRRIVGDAAYDVVWVTAYRFHQRLADRFRVGRVFLVGDAAHLMSPFGARGLNSGVADAENLAWKLAWVLSGRSPDSLLDTYHDERRAAASENLAVTDATMRFMVPPSRMQRLSRNAVLRLSRLSARARIRVDSGRLATAHVYERSPVVEAAAGTDGPRPGSVAPDGPVEGLSGPPARRLRELLGREVLGLLIVPVDWVAPSRWPVAPTLVVVPTGSARPPLPEHVAVVVDSDGVLARTYAPAGLPAGGVLYVVRPDSHLAARRDLAHAEELAQLPDLVSFAAGRESAALRPRRPDRRGR